MHTAQASAVELDIETYTVRHVRNKLFSNIAQWSRDDPFSIGVQHQLNLTRVLCVVSSEHELFPDI